MKDVRRTLEELGVKPVKGQNFLVSENVVEALVAAGEVDGKRVLEIGAGTGNLTAELAEEAAKVYAVESDTTLAGHLEDRFRGRNVEVVNADILDCDWPDVDRCVANLPFQVSSEVLEMLGERQIQSALILQGALADRIVAEPGGSEYSRLTVMVNYYFIPVKLRDVKSMNYHPEPDVGTAIVKLYPNVERHGVEKEDAFFRAVRGLFTHRRKKVRNAFVDARHILGIEKEEAKQLRDELPHSEQRVVNLDIRSLAEIAEFLEERVF